MRLTVRLLRFAKLCNSCSSTWKNLQELLSVSRAAVLAIFPDNNPITQDIFDCSHDLNDQSDRLIPPSQRTFLKNHPHRLKFVPSSGEVRDSAYLLHCLSLHKKFLAERYWETKDVLD
ncbi:hypothetical protein TNIN_473121 [Trichonephila inaurata madagascariensis]|uniref:Uncharacterized protein n=1 Tax=Trichonephila inaurata madagascariensis TaxID=2747483 RepID=A0A8X7C6C3_9ARAC|nr:hypothetical protein TNIN_473121 [Trichonephila inaurata madagascariensis]